MELPNPDSQSSQIVLVNASDSQVFGPSDSLSLPSEPPEIRNWFPNYQYESLKLDTSDLFGGSICEETELGEEKVLLNDREKAKEDGVRGFKELETIDKVPFGDDKCEKQSMSENIDFSHSPSLPSEPNHVRNWFSNYVYESPALDSNDGFRDSVYEELEREEYGLNVEERNGARLQDCEEYRINRITNDVESSDGQVNNSTSSVNNMHKYLPVSKADPGHGEGNQNLSHKSNMRFGSALTHCSKYHISQNYGTSTIKDDVKPNLGRDDSQCPTEFCREIHILPPRLQRCSEKSTHRIEIAKDPEANGRKDGFSSPESNTKLVLMNVDGFVTTRKFGFSRESEENTLETPRENNGKRSDSKAGIDRKALAERTNFQHCSAAEITGKWHCPQKRKPNPGPPLKQLRLERWVQRLREL